MPENTCLYCPEPALSLEHIIPAALGEFEHAPLLQDCICRTCNNQLGLLDEQMTRSGPEAFIRRYYNITGRPGHDSVNPFYRGSAGGKRLEMQAFDPNLGFEILFERTDGDYRQLRQLVFIEQTSRKTGHIPIGEKITPEELRAAYNRLELTPPLDMYVICGQEEMQWVQDLLRATSPGTGFDPGSQGTKIYGSGTAVSFSLTERYFRAVAKIGFHYFLSQFPQYSGHEQKFADIRRYITTGDKDVNRANEFVGERKLPLVGEALGGRTGGSGISFAPTLPMGSTAPTFKPSSVKTSSRASTPSSWGVAPIILRIVPQGMRSFISGADTTASLPGKPTR